MSAAQSEKLLEGIVVETLPSAMFRIKLSEDVIVLAYLSGRMRIHHIRILPGDRVLVKMSSDGARGIIMRRM